MGTFQIILYESSNEIQIQYRDLLGNDRALGNSATIGIKKDSSTYKQFSYNIASLTQGQVIRYTPNGANDYTVQSSVPEIGEEVSPLYDLIYLAPEGAPASPNLVNPSDGTTGITTTPTFEWLPVDSATSYTVLISTVSNFSSTVVNQSGISNTSYTHNSNLNSSTQYYWRVQATNSEGNSLSSTRTFTTGSANTAPNSPINVSSTSLLGATEIENVSGSTLTTFLSDDDEGETVRYRLQIATDSNFNNLVIDYRSAFADEGEFSYTFGENYGTYLVGNHLTTLNPDSYYLRIRTEDIAAGSSNWYSPAGVAFTVFADETAPIISQINITAASDEATINWQTNEAGSSQVEYGLLPSYGSQTSEINTSTRVTAHNIVISELKNCARYFYRVKSTDESDNQGISNQQTFSTSGCPISDIITGAENTVTNTGGEVVLTQSYGTAQVSFPENFYTETVKVQINRLNSEIQPPKPENKELAGDNYFDLLAVDQNNNRISLFNENVIFTISYDENIENNFEENTLDVYRYENDAWTKLNCNLDINANTLTCALPSFSVYAVFGSRLATINSLSNQNSNESNNALSNNNSNETQVCTETPPASIPQLYQVDRTRTTATLYFVPSSGNVSGYIIEYGENDKANQHAVKFDHPDQSGAVSYTIERLSPFSTWYFKVKSFHGCAYSDWSDIKTVETEKNQKNEDFQEPTIEGRLEKITLVENKELEVIINQQEQVLSNNEKGENNLLLSIKKSWHHLEKIFNNIVTVTADLFDSNPTTISGLKVAEVGTNYAIIVWETNHYATSKVSYGNSYDYGQDVQDNHKTKKHQVRIENLDSNTIYYYEAMSQGKTYVFDARHEFITN